MKKYCSLLIIIVLISLITSVFATTKYNMELEVESKEIEVGQKKVIFYIDLTQYSGDGLLGYEGILEFDKDVFESALVESLNGWDNATYAPTTGKILATTSNAKAGTQIAKITLTLKDNINKDETKVKLNNFTLSDGNPGETFNKFILYTFKKSEQTTNQIEENLGSDIPLGNNNVDQNIIEQNNATPVATNVVETIKENEETTTDNNKKIEPVEELKDKDSTTAKGAIPQAGSTLIQIIILAVIAIAGIAGFIRFKTIKLK